MYNLSSNNIAIVFNTFFLPGLGRVVVLPWDIWDREERYRWVEMEDIKIVLIK